MRSQSEAIRGYCERHHLDLLRIEEDGGESSKTMDRPGLKRILARLDSGEIGGIVVAYVDRLTRNLRDACELVDRYFTIPGGYEILSAREPVDTRSAIGRAQFFMLIVFSQYLREAGVERTRDNASTKRRSSERTGRDHFGLKVDPTNPSRSKTDRPNALVADPGDVAALAEIQRLKLGGFPIRQIARWLTAHGFKPKRGGERWSPSTVADLLKKSPPESSI